MTKSYVFECAQEKKTKFCDNTSTFSSKVCIYICCCCDTFLFDSTHKVEETLSRSVLLLLLSIPFLRLKNLFRDWNWNLKLLLQ